MLYICTYDVLVVFDALKIENNIEVGMYKIKKLIICVVVSFLVVSCCLNPTDRKLLNEASLDAKDAKLLATSAILLATEAAQDADEAKQKSEESFKQYNKK